MLHVCFLISQLHFNLNLINIFQCVSVYSALIHVTLDQYKQRVTEEDLYSDVNFIIQDQGDLLLICILHVLFSLSASLYMDNLCCYVCMCQDSMYDLE